MQRHARGKHGPDSGGKKSQRVDPGLVLEAPLVGDSPQDGEDVFSRGDCGANDAVDGTDDVGEGLPDPGVGALESGFDCVV